MGEMYSRAMRRLGLLGLVGWLAGWLPCWPGWRAGLPTWGWLALAGLPAWLRWAGWSGLSGWRPGRLKKLAAWAGLAALGWLAGLAGLAGCLGPCRYCARRKVFVPVDSLYFRFESSFGRF